MQYTEFNEQFKMSNYNLYFEADSYNRYISELFPEFDEYTVGEKIELDNGFAFTRRIFEHKKTVTPRLIDFTPYDKNNGLDVYQGSKWSKAYFSDDVIIPVLSRYSTTWMSITPMEIATCRTGVRKAKGTVIMGGLGMGWMAKKVLDRKHVDKLVIVELEPSVIEFFGKAIKEKYQDRVEILQGDFYEHANTVDYDVALVDIFDSYGTANYDRDFKTFKQAAIANNKICWAWGDVAKTPNIPYSYF
jgi:hypothetical protein